jgi:hypothetical protein
MKKVIYASKPLTKKQMCAKFDFTKEQREARKSLGPIQETWTVKSHKRVDVVKAINTLTDCRVCDKFTEIYGEPAVVVDSLCEPEPARIKVICSHCGHEDAFMLTTDYTEKGVSFTAQFEDQRLYKHLRVVQ